MLKTFLSTIVLMRVCVAQTPNEILAATMVLEAGGESDSRAMAVVLEVVRNRAALSGHPAHVEALKPKQFSCFNKIGVVRAVNLAKKHPKFPLAMSLLSERSKYTQGSTFYHNTKVNPYWVKYKKFTVKIGGHLFYK